MRKIVGAVTEEEKNAIRVINNHKCSLEELLMILPDESELRKKARTDLDETNKKYQKWWSDCQAKYQWEKGVGDWTIIFETNEIVIQL